MQRGNRSKREDLVRGPGEFASVLMNDRGRRLLDPALDITEITFSQRNTGIAILYTSAMEFRVYTSLCVGKQTRPKLWLPSIHRLGGSLFENLEDLLCSLRGVWFVNTTRSKLLEAFNWRIKHSENRKVRVFEEHLASVV